MRIAEEIILGNFLKLSKKIPDSAIFLGVNSAVFEHRWSLHFNSAFNILRCRAEVERFKRIATDMKSSLFGGIKLTDENAAEFLCQVRYRRMSKETNAWLHMNPWKRYSDEVMFTFSSY